MINSFSFSSLKLPETLVTVSGLLALSYYGFWMVGKRHRLLPLLRWFVKLLNPSRHNEAGDISGLALNASLSTRPLSASAQVITLLRFALVTAVLWRWWRQRAAQPPWLEDPGKQLEPILSFCLAVGLTSYICLIHWARRRAEKAQEELRRWEAADGPLSTSAGLWSPHLPDEFFLPAIFDVVFITIAAVCLPGDLSEVHLGYAVPVVSAWLFRAEGRAFILWVCIAISLYVQWHCLSCLVTGHHWWEFSQLLTSNQYDRLHILLALTVPRMAFWLIVCCVMMVMRALRRDTEKQALFFRTLADSMPYEVFVKDARRRFIYVNNKFLSKLRPGRENSSVKLFSILQKTDDEVGIEPNKSAAYQKVDEALLSGNESYYHGVEPSYGLGSASRIETIKVLMLGPDRKPAYILGVIRDPETDKLDAGRGPDEFWRLYEYIFSNVADGICKTNEEGTYLLINSSFAKLYGFDDVASFQAVIQNAKQLYTNPEDRLRLLRDLQEKKSVTNFAFRASIKGDSSQSRLFSQNVARHKSDSDGTYYLIGVCQSLEHRAETDRKLLELARYATTAALLAYPFHDVERVLKTAQYIAREARKARCPIEKQIKEFDEYCEPALTLLQLARDIRNSRNIDQYMQPFDLLDLSRIWWEEHRFRNEFRKRNIQIAEPVGSRAEARIVFPLIGNICLELLRNVAHHAKGATRIDWTVGHLDGRNVFIDISDNGCGFPESVLSYEGVLLPWEFAVRAGFGIHLVATKHIIEELHHGRLILSRNQINGASVRLVLPKVP
ncbi:MAG TPA: ATP-binding protein [Verrucomicrobiae bacterium]|jgi:PAS domain-containing protein